IDALLDDARALVLREALRGLRHVCPGAPALLDDARALELIVRLHYRVRRDLEPERERADRRQLLARAQRSRSDQVADLIVDLPIDRNAARQVYREVQGLAIK